MTERNEHDAFLTKREAANRYKVTTRTVERWIKRDGLQSFKTPGGLVRIRVTDLDAIMTPSSPVDSASSPAESTGVSSSAASSSRDVGAAADQHAA